VRPSLIVISALAAMAVLLFTPAAKAGLLTTGPAAVCDTSVVQPFTPWGDQSSYVLIPGGSFEAGTTSWTRTGEASIAKGNETYFVHSTADSHSLVLPPGSSVTTPSMCFATGDWHLRLFAVNTGTPSSLKVTIIVRSLIGVLSVLDGGKVSSTGSWQPSDQIQLTLTNVTGLVGTQAVSFRFTPTGYSGSWRIDDVYLDPWVST